MTSERNGERGKEGESNLQLPASHSPAGHDCPRAAQRLAYEELLTPDLGPSPRPHFISQQLSEVPPQRLVWGMRTQGDGLNVHRKAGPGPVQGPPQFPKGTESDGLQPQVPNVQKPLPSMAPGLIGDPGWVSMGEVCCSDRLALQPQWFPRRILSHSGGRSDQANGARRRRWGAVHGPQALDLKRVHVAPIPSSSAQ